MGPACWDVDKLETLIEQGMNVVSYVYGVVCRVLRCCVCVCVVGGGDDKAVIASALGLLELKRDRR